MPELSCGDNYGVDLLGIDRDKSQSASHFYLIGSFSGIEEVTWQRVLRDTSEATVTLDIPASSPGCCALLEKTQPRLTYIRVWRGPDVVWEGEVMQRIEPVAAQPAQIVARDCTQRLEECVNTHNLNYTTAQDLADIAVSIITRNLTDNFNDPVDSDLILPGIITIPNSQDYKYRPGLVRETVLGILKNMAQGYGLDFTVVNRSLIIWRRDTGRETTIARINTSDLSGDAEVVVNGLDACTYGWATNQIAGDKPDPDPTKNLLVGSGTIGSIWGRIDQLTHVGDYEADADDLERAAENLLWNALPPPTVIRMPGSAKVLPAAPVDIRTIIPGARVDVFVNTRCSSVRQGMRITDVNVTWTPGNKETVAIGLSTLSDVTAGDESVGTFSTLASEPVRRASIAARAVASVRQAIAAFKPG
jgi:hypothetical protein